MGNFNGNGNLVNFSAVIYKLKKAFRFFGLYGPNLHYNSTYFDKNFAREVIKNK